MTTKGSGYYSCSRCKIKGVHRDVLLRGVYFPSKDFDEGQRKDLDYVEVMWDDLQAGICEKLEKWERSCEATKIGET